MTMTLDEVRKTRFHMSRRNGYEVTDVDIFVDKVEETIQALTTENESLRQQGGGAPDAGNAKETEALRQQVARMKDEVEAGKAKVTSLTGELDKARQVAASQPAPAAPAPAAPNEAQVRELAQAKAQVEELKTQLAQTKAQLTEAQKNTGSQDRIVQLTGENHQLREQIERVMTQARTAGDSSAPITVTTSPEASSAVVRLVQLATEQADNLVTEATTEATKRKQAVEEQVHTLKQDADSYVSRVKSEADAHAAQVKSEAQFSAEEMLRKATESSAQLTTEAQERVERMDKDARTNAERLVQEAQQRAATIDSEIAARRTEVFGALETERDVLFAKVEKLKTYEKSYRSTMTQYLKTQVERLDSSKFAPDEVPELLQAPGKTASEWSADTTSTTPRLDALLEG